MRDLNRPNTKWNFFNLDIKVVLDNQPLVGTGPLPDWLRNMAHGRTMTVLDTFSDNLCLWRCLAVYRGTIPHRSTTAALQLAQGYVGAHCEKTSLNELDNVERYLNANKPLEKWLGIRLYEPERTEAEEVVWYLCRNTIPQIKNLVTIEVFDGYTFLFKEI